MTRISALVAVGLGLCVLAVALHLVGGAAAAVGDAVGVTAIGLVVIGAVRTALGLNRRR